MQDDRIKHVQINRLVFRKLNVKNKLASLMPDVEYVMFSEHLADCFTKQL